LLRPGTITRQQIAAVTNLPVVDADATDRRASPGTRHRHYAPTAHVQLFFDLDTLAQSLRQGAGQRSAVVLSATDPLVGLPWRPLSGDTLYAEMRRADELHVDEILVHCDGVTACDEALMDRLLRAADNESEAGRGT
jgi:L-threonylcarbamoyladenylate synthase